MPPILIGSMLFANPLLSSVVINAPHKVASPVAGMRRSGCGVLWRKRWIAMSLRAPMTLL